MAAKEIDGRQLSNAASLLHSLANEGQDDCLLIEKLDSDNAAGMRALWEHVEFVAYSLELMGKAGEPGS